MRFINIWGDFNWFKSGWIVYVIEVKIDFCVFIYFIIIL